MFKRLTIILLMLAVGANVAAGMPVHPSGGESGMMDCCKAALEKNDSPRIAAARLCCAMNCNEPASTNGNTSRSFSQTGAEPTPLVVVALPPAAKYKSPRANYSEPTSASSNPAYILNLALLI